LTSSGPLSLAAAAVGADGIIVEVHRTRKRRSATDRSSCASRTFAEYASLVERAAQIAGKAFSNA